MGRRRWKHRLGGMARVEAVPNKAGDETQSCKEGRKESAREVKSQCKSPEVIEGRGARHEIRERGLLTRVMGNGCFIRTELGSLLGF